MDGFLPPRTSIRNFQADDLEGKMLFRKAAATLEMLFADPSIHDIAKSTPHFASNAVALEPTTQAAIEHSLAELLHLRTGFQSLIGESARHGEDVPVMTQFVRFVEGRGNKADQFAKDMANEMTNSRPVHAEDLSKESFKTLLLECAVLDHWVNTQDAGSAFREMLSRTRAQIDTSISQSPLPWQFTTQAASTEAYQFMAFHDVIVKAYAHLQEVLGVAIPPEEVTALIAHPLDAHLSTAGLDDIRRQFFKLPQEHAGSFVLQFLNNAASVKSGSERFKS